MSTSIKVLSIAVAMQSLPYVASCKELNTDFSGTERIQVLQDFAVERFETMAASSDTTDREVKDDGAIPMREPQFLDSTRVAGCPAEWLLASSVLSKPPAKADADRGALRRRVVIVRYPSKHFMLLSPKVSSEQKLFVMLVNDFVNGESVTDALWIRESGSGNEICATVIDTYTRGDDSGDKGASYRVAVFKLSHSDSNGFEWIPTDNISRSTENRLLKRGNN